VKSYEIQYKEKESLRAQTKQTPRSFEYAGSKKEPLRSSVDENAHTT